MKRFLLVTGFISTALFVNAQKSYDYGLFLGMTQSHLSSILPIPDNADPKLQSVPGHFGLNYAAGGYYRYSLNSRYAIRGGANAGFKRDYLSPYLGEVYGLFEFNFHPLSPKRDKHLITSYIDVGLSYLIDFEEKKQADKFNDVVLPPSKYWIRNLRIPFNVGVRYNATPTLTIGVEWAIRKGYQLDYRDTNAIPEYTPLMANWRSHVGITVGYMVSNYCRTCPFYENERKKLK